MVTWHILSEAELSRAVGTLSRGTFTTDEFSTTLDGNVVHDGHGSITLYAHYLPPATGAGARRQKCEDGTL